MDLIELLHEKAKAPRMTATKYVQENIWHLVTKFKMTRQQLRQEASIVDAQRASGFAPAPKKTKKAEAPKKVESKVKPKKAEKAPTPKAKPKAKSKAKPKSKKKA